ncbi:hypothetical protein LXH13_16785 [Streptomyces spinosirectus]|uniref:hypothetical protein n=1 Tax=Streptomyces spinosirectus TaxID=2906474 RepID=UPI001F253E64|nr:hypothetical protein [Streptomyces spinosirectus]UIR18599.1 hypothetical protein LXH13_16785 [Streptomyces spinosirectus]
MATKASSTLRAPRRGAGVTAGVGTVVGTGLGAGPGGGGGGGGGQADGRGLPVWVCADAHGGGVCPACVSADAHGGTEPGGRVDQAAWPLSSLGSRSGPEPERRSSS